MSDNEHEECTIRNENNLKYHVKVNKVEGEMVMGPKYVTYVTVYVKDQPSSAQDSDQTSNEPPNKNDDQTDLKTSQENLQTDDQVVTSSSDTNSQNKTAVEKNKVAETDVQNRCVLEASENNHDTDNADETSGTNGQEKATEEKKNDIHSSSDSSDGESTWVKLMGTLKSISGSTETTLDDSIRNMGHDPENFTEILKTSIDFYLEKVKGLLRQTGTNHVKSDRISMRISHESVDWELKVGSGMIWDISEISRRPEPIMVTTAPNNKKFFIEVPLKLTDIDFTARYNWTKENAEGQVLASVPSIFVLLRLVVEPSVSENAQWVTVQSDFTIHFKRRNDTQSFFYDIVPTCGKGDIPKFRKMLSQKIKASLMKAFQNQLTQLNQHRIDFVKRLNGRESLGLGRHNFYHITTAMVNIYMKKLKGLLSTASRTAGRTGIKIPTTNHKGKITKATVDVERGLMESLSRSDNAICPISFSGDGGRINIFVRLRALPTKVNALYSVETSEKTTDTTETGSLVISLPSQCVRFVFRLDHDAGIVLQQLLFPSQVQLDFERVNDIVDYEQFAVNFWRLVKGEMSVRLTDIINNGMSE